MHPKRSFDIFFHFDYGHYNRALVHPVKPKDAVCNEQLDVMWKGKFRIWEPARRLDQLNRLIRRGSGEFDAAAIEPYDAEGLLGRFPPHLSFTEAEEERGKQGLAAMGMEPGVPFVCFHARDGQWLPQARPRITALYGEWTTQDPERNAPIGDFLPAAEKLTELGYYAIRMGKYVEEPLHSSNPRIIDYSIGFQSDFMDVYLSARCSFFMGGDTGLTSLPMIFRTPMAFVNIPPYGTGIDHCGYEAGIIIPKTLCSTEKGEVLSLRETMDLSFARSGPRNSQQKEIATSMGLEILDNTPEELIEAAIEMDLRRQSAFIRSKEDEELQDRWVSIIQEYPDIIRVQPDRFRHIQAGAHFMRSHPGWLD